MACLLWLCISCCVVVSLDIRSDILVQVQLLIGLETTLPCFTGYLESTQLYLLSLLLWLVAASTIAMRIDRTFELKASKSV